MVRNVLDVETLERIRRYALKNDLQVGALLVRILRDGILPKDGRDRVSRVFLSFGVTRAALVDREISVSA